MVEEDKKGVDINKPPTPPGTGSPTQPSDLRDKTAPIGFTVTTPEMEKYKNMLAKNPTSRVFAALSELYRKGGMLDEAIKLCLTGISHHPKYMSGRVALGRAYFDKGMYKEAKEELDKVVSTTPDNIVANKVLGEIHLLEKDLVKARECFERVEKISPNDEEVIEKLKIIEDGGYKTPAPKEEEPKEEEPIEAAAEEKIEAVEEEPVEEEAIEAEPIIEDAEILEEVQEEKGEEVEETPDIFAESEEEEAFDEDFFDDDLPVSEEEAIVESLEERKETFTGEEPERMDLSPPTGEAEEEAEIEDVGEFDFEEGDEDMLEDDMGILKETFNTDLDIKDIAEEIVDSTEALELEEFSEEPEEDEIDKFPEEEEDFEREGINISTETIADIYVKQGYFNKALSIYEDLNTAYPGRQNLKDKLEYVKKKIEEKKVEKEGPKKAEEKTFAETVFDKDTVQKNIEKLGKWLMNIREYKKM